MLALAWPLLGMATLTGVACSATPVSVPSHVDVISQRMVLTWRQELPSDAGSRSAFEAELSRIARVPVRLAATVSLRTTAVEFACASGPACADAERRLRAHAEVIDLVPDGRSRTHNGTPRPAPTPP